MVRPPLYGLEVDRKYIKCDECIIKKRARNEPIRNGYTYQRKPVGYLRTGFPDGLCRGFCDMYMCTADWVALKQKYSRRDETTTSTNHVTNNHEISADNTDIFFI